MSSSAMAVITGGAVSGDVTGWATGGSEAVWMGGDWTMLVSTAFQADEGFGSSGVGVGSMVVTSSMAGCSVTGIGIVLMEPWGRTNGDSGDEDEVVGSDLEVVATVADFAGKASIARLFSMLDEVTTGALGSDDWVLARGAVAVVGDSPIAKSSRLIQRNSPAGGETRSQRTGGDPRRTGSPTRMSRSPWSNAMYSTLCAADSSDPTRVFV